MILFLLSLLTILWGLVEISLWIILYILAFLGVILCVGGVLFLLGWLGRITEPFLGLVRTILGHKWNSFSDFLKWMVSYDCLHVLGCRCFDGYIMIDDHIEFLVDTTEENRRLRKELEDGRTLADTVRAQRERL
jgi:hypothetical protein